MKRKSILAILVSVVLAGSLLAGCGDSSAKTEKAASSSVAEESAAEETAEEEAGAESTSEAEAASTSAEEETEEAEAASTSAEEETEEAEAASTSAEEETEEAEAASTSAEEETEEAEAASTSAEEETEEAEAEAASTSEEETEAVSTSAEEETEEAEAASTSAEEEAEEAEAASTSAEEETEEAEAASTSAEEETEEAEAASTSEEETEAVSTSAEEETEEAEAASTSEEEETEAVAASEEEEVEAAGEYKIGFSQATMASPFYVTMVDEFESYCKEKGVEPMAISADEDVQKQNQDILDMIAAEIDALILNPINLESVQTGIDACVEAGIPVITVDRMASSGGTAVVKRDNYEMGRLTGEALLEALGGADAAEGTILELQGTAGDQVMMDRRDGFESVFKDVKGIKIVQSVNCDYVRAKALTAAQDMIQGNDNIVAIYGHNDDMAMGGLQAAQEAGLEDVLVCGVDGLMEAVKAIADGEGYVATTLNDPGTELKVAADTALKVLNGEDYEEEVDAGTGLIDTSNAADYVDDSLSFAAMKGDESAPAAESAPAEEEETEAASISEEKEAEAASTSEEEETEAASTSIEEEAETVSTSEEEEVEAASTSEEEEAEAASTSEEEEAEAASTSEEEEAEAASTSEEKEVEAASTSEEEAEEAISTSEEDIEKATPAEEEDTEKADSAEEPAEDEEAAEEETGIAEAPSAIDDKAGIVEEAAEEAETEEASDKEEVEEKAPAEEDTKAAEEEGEVVPAESYKIGFSQATMASPFYVTMVDEFEQYCKEKGVEPMAISADEDVQKQNQDILDMIAAEIDALILNPINLESVQTGIDACVEAGIPVITVDRMASSGGTAVVKRDNYEMGRLTGEALLEALGGADAAEGTILELQGTAGDQVMMDRRDGFESVFKDVKGIKIVQSVNCDYVRAKALTAAQDLIQGNENIVAIYGHNDDMAMGGLQAAQEAGLEDVLVCGVDGLMDAVEAIADGEGYVATTLNDPGTELKVAADTAIKVLNGEEYEEEVDAGTGLIDTSNAADYVDDSLSFAAMK